MLQKNLDSVMNSDFVLVSKKKKSRRKLCTASFFRRIASICDEISTSSYCENLIDTLEEILSEQQLDSFEEIVCYGLGSVEETVNSKYQFGLLVNLKEHFKSKVQIYDPEFKDGDLALLKHYDFNIIENNEFGKRLISSNTLVFLPHCPHELLNNLLWKNWDLERLKKCVVFGNSIGHFVDYTPTKPKDSFEYICRVHSVVEEIVIKNRFKFSDVFNDLSVHCFTAKKLEESPIELFDFNEEPNYDNLPIEYRKKLS